jgi:hypothetical protein
MASQRKHATPSIRVKTEAKLSALDGNLWRTVFALRSAPPFIGRLYVLFMLRVLKTLSMRPDCDRDKERCCRLSMLCAHETTASANQRALPYKAYSFLLCYIL